MRPQEHTRHYVYIMGRNRENGIAGPVKVGITENPDRRLPSIQTGCPFNVGFVAVFALPTKEMARDVERAFHEIMQPFQTSGEWFDLNPIKAVQAMCENLRAYIASYKDSTKEEREFAYYAIGAWDAEQKATQESYRAAWEAQA